MYHRYLNFILLLLVALIGCDAAERHSADVRPPTEPLKPSAPQTAEDYWNDHKQGLPFVIGYQQGVDQAKATGKPAFVFVTTTWCGWCKKLAKENFNDPEIRSLLERFVLVIVDGDSEREVVERLRVTGFPHVVLQNATGRALVEIRGYVAPDELKPELEHVLNTSESGA